MLENLNLSQLQQLCEQIVTNISENISNINPDELIDFINSHYEDSSASINSLLEILMNIDDFNAFVEESSQDTLYNDDNFLNE